jgi:hypothetical protein
MRAGRTLRGAGFGLALAVLSGCVPPAVVFLSPHYQGAKIRQVALVNFLDHPAAPGSGQVAASIFEKYLLLGGYGLADRSQVQTVLDQDSSPLSGNVDLDTLHALAKKLGVDAVAMGQVTDYSDASDRTVMEDMPLEQTSPILGRQSVEQQVNGVRVRTETDVVTGYATSTTDVPVQSVQTIEAHVGLSVRLVDSQTGEVLWSGSASADAPHLHAAVEEASSTLMQAVAKRLNP